MKMLLISTCHDLLSDSEFVAPIANMFPGSAYAHFASLDQKMLHDATHIIICGTALADFEYLDQGWAWLREFKKPVLGICSGAQVIAREFGWKLVKHQRIGVHPLKVMKESALLSEDAQAYFLHSYDVEGGEVLATVGAAQGLTKVKNKPIYACAFHPEVMNESLIRAFLASELL